MNNAAIHLNELEVGKREVAIFQGISGQAEVDDAAARVTFWPDEAGMASPAYQQTIAQVGDEWSEWVFEVDVAMRREQGILLIEL